MKIQISRTLSKLPVIDYRSVQDFQKNLKDLTEENYNRLLKSFKEFGFIVPMFLWKNGNEFFAIDTHQRLRVLKKENITPYELPYVLIEAGDKTEAAKRLLAISSQYGRITQEGLDTFLAENLIEEDWLKDTIFFDALPIENFVDDNFTTDFALPNGDKAPFQQMTFTLADAQAERIKKAISKVEVKKGTEFGNENSNGNSLHQIILEWDSLKKLS